MGPLGWRRDQWGATDNYLDDILKNNKKRIDSGPALKDLIKTRYRTAPVTGEPPRYVNKDGRCAYWNLERQVEDYGASLIGDGNWGVAMEDCAISNARSAFKRSGYRIILEGGSLSADTIASNKPFSITLKWKNIGVAPTYEEWDVLFQLTDNSKKITWSGISQFKPKLFIPQDENTPVTDDFILPAGIPPGSYELSVVIKDPAHYRPPLPLAIAGRRPDGSYLIKSITVSAEK